MHRFALLRAASRAGHVACLIALMDVMRLFEPDKDIGIEPKGYLLLDASILPQAAAT
jgi:hypothetical protein